MRCFLLCLLALTLSACDSGSESSLRLDGTFEGSGEVQIATGADPIPIQVDVEVTFDDVEPGSATADLRVEATSFSAPEVYTGTGTGSLSADGTLALSSTLTQVLQAASGGNRSITFNVRGQATSSRITADVTGSLPFDGLVLTRR